MAVLTDRKRGVLLAVADHIRDHGYPPSLRQIAETVGLTSVDTVRFHLRTLVAEGLLVTEPLRPRTVALAKGVAVWPDGSITRTVALLCEVCDQLAAPDHDCGSDVRQLLQLAANTVHPSPGLDRIRALTHQKETPR